MSAMENGLHEVELTEVEKLRARITYLEGENNDLADENQTLTKALAKAERSGEITLEPAVGSMFARFIEDANKRREANGQRTISDSCFWASDLVDKGIKAMRGQWKSGDGYRLAKGLLEQAQAARRSGDTAMVLELIAQMEEIKRAK